MPILRLIRLPGVFTALADVLAGYLLVRLVDLRGLTEDTRQLTVLGLLLGCSACLYMAGMAFNDVFDAEHDRAQRPERPIPSGAISLSAAFFLAALAMTAGLLLAMRAGMTSFLAAATLALAILLYDAGLKRVPVLGAPTMGLCRGLNFILGMTAHPFAPVLPIQNPALFLPPLLLMIYTTAITVLATLESAGDDPSASRRDGPSAHRSPGDDSEARIDPEAEEALADPPSDAPTELHETPDAEGATLRDRLQAAQSRYADSMNIVLAQNQLPPPTVARSTVAPPPSSLPPLPAVGALGEGTPPSRPANGLVLGLSLATLLAVPLCAAWILPWRRVALIAFGVNLGWLLLAAWPAWRKRTGAAIRRMVGAGILGICILDGGMVAALASQPDARAIPAGLAMLGALMGLAWILRRYIAVA